MSELSIKDQVKTLFEENDLLFSYSLVSKNTTYPKYTFTVSIDNKALVQPFITQYHHSRDSVSKGTKVPTPPDLVDVLYCLISDGQLAEESFEDFCANLGYDTDSRKALDIYLDCQKQSQSLTKVIGRNLYNTFATLLEDY